MRTARPPALCKAVCALSPTELMARGARQPHTARRAHTDEYSAAERKEMDAMYERHELLFLHDGSEL